MSSSPSTRSPQATSLHTSATSYPTRTLAIIKSHAVQHRLTIERRIVEAGFEIIKERQMQFDTESDGAQESLQELFGRDALSLSSDPVWVYVLERRRAVEVWNTLMGDEDPERARIHSPNSLRAEYGVSLRDNAFIGSPDTLTAEAQIAAVFISSPPFPSAEYADEIDPMTLSPPYPRGSLRSLNSYRSGSSGEMPYANGSPAKGGFKARAVPTTNAVPTSQPRLTRAASLRMGIAAPAAGGSGARTLRTKEEQTAVFMDVPGHKRSATIAVASTSAPTLAPRPTRASVLREHKEAAAKVPSWGVAPPPRPAKEPAPAQPVRAASFEGVPGHKRRETLDVASTRPPVLAPRQNRAAALRVAKDAATPAPAFGSGAGTAKPATLGRAASTGAMANFDGVPGHKRRETLTVASTRAPVVAPRPNRAAALRLAKDAAPAPAFGSGAGSTKPVIVRSASAMDFGSTPGHKRTESIAAPVLSTRPPSITPRQNKSAALRVAKPAAPPSSYMFRGPAPAPALSSRASFDSGRTSSVGTSDDAGSPPRVVAAPRPPSIEPRSNRSALLRAKSGGM